MLLFRVLSTLIVRTTLLCSVEGIQVLVFVSVGLCHIMSYHLMQFVFCCVSLLCSGASVRSADIVERLRTFCARSELKMSSRLSVLQLLKKVLCIGFVVLPYFVQLVQLIVVNQLSAVSYSVILNPMGRQCLLPFTSQCESTLFFLFFVLLCDGRVLWCL